MKLRHNKTLTPGGGLDAGADAVLESLNLPATRGGTLPEPRTTRLEPRGFVPTEVPEAYATLPPVLAEIASVAGLHAATALAEARGGTRIYIPAVAGDEHWLVRTLGREAADRLTGYYGSAGADGVARGAVLSLPLGGVGLRAETHRQLDAMIRRGCSQTEITMAIGVSRDTVKRRRSKLRGELAGGEQLTMLELFDDTAGRSLFETFADEIAREVAAAMALPVALLKPSTGADQ